ncbi:MAG TPA: threonine/serine exporter [Staphylococcus sp.]|uniref:Threonine/serine exporter family protein n=2 Tax=Mammaliicoccus vitulinus TaxID=71237 RepID=A0ABX7HG54_9STAP|nr:threonine/serine exporter family protein [Mammaliicoccus vitulinus]HAL10624.1 threonine/serine exporter [Staphylococcus sp.]MBM6630450.1 threonine/serine exporter family protein [Mammaliicoccus vitulinus]MEB7657851.1 threonine/serine exporter family protein [Mammaliicoccus vitulinus]PNZ37570.1 threonine/serine exporter [Mammaliicoccus vitulinus]QJF24382.1 threonine/serine exporter family protein [Mammaliicoccus vitulinus]
MNQQHYPKELVQEIVMNAGLVLLEAGSEAFRVEDTMFRMAKHLGYPNNQCYVSSTIINFALDIDDNIRVYRVKKRDTNLGDIHYVNNVSRMLEKGQITAEEALKRIRTIHESPLPYSLPFKMIAAGLISVFFSYLFSGAKEDIIATFIAGAIGYCIVELLHSWTSVKFIAEIVAACAIALIAVYNQMLLGGDTLNIAIISAVMPIVPGVLITNAIQDLFLGQLLVGISKGLEATFTSIAIGVGVGIVLLIFS